MRELLEISDLIVAYDPDTLERRAVHRAEVVDALAGAGDRRGARVAARLPVDGGDVLDEAAVDALLIRAHTELQRLSEEFNHAWRVRTLLAPLLGALRGQGAVGRIPIVDIGCGLGFVIRALAADGGLGDDVELIGCDYNVALVGQATRLAAVEGLRCRFVVGNAFHLDVPEAVFISSGVLHHFRGGDLESFFAGQAHALGFAHYDVCPSRLAPWGARVFHWARMREPLSRHDGINSARRAHSDAELAQAARRGAPGLEIRVLDPAGRRPAFINVLRPVVGLRAELYEAFADGSPALADRLVSVP